MHLEISVDSHLRFRWTKFKKRDPDCADAIKIKPFLVLYDLNFLGMPFVDQPRFRKK